MDTVRETTDAEDRLRLVTYLAGVTTVTVNQADVRDVLAALDAARASCEERGHVIENLIAQRDRAADFRV